MRESAMPAPDREVTRTDNEIMRPGNPAVPASCFLDKFPDRVFANLREDPGCIDILAPWHKHSCSPAVLTGNLRLVRHRLDDLVGMRFTMITVSMVSGENEPVTHGK